MKIEEKYSEIISMLQKVRKSGEGHQARCPAHDDENPSLSLRVADDRRRILVHCHAGCSPEQVLSAIGMDTSCLFAEERVGAGRTRRVKVAEYVYKDVDGNPIRKKIRYEPKGFSWQHYEGSQWLVGKGSHLEVPYRLNEIVGAPTVYIVEGEKDADRLWAEGLPATTSSGNKVWTSEMSEYFKGKHVVVIPDNDDAGRKHAERIEQSLHGVAEEVTLVTNMEVGAKGDVSDFLDSGNTIDDLIGLIERLPEKKQGFTQPLSASRTAAGLLVTKSVNDWLSSAKSTPMPRMLFGEFWFEGEISILFADTGLGKSTLAVQLAQSIARGDAFDPFQCEVDCQKVLYLDFELSEKQFESRYSAGCKGGEFSSDHFVFSEWFFRAELNSEDFECDSNGSFEDNLLKAIEDQLSTTDAKVLIIDNLTYLADEMEKAKNALPLMKRLKEMKARRGISILVIGHPPKLHPSMPISKNHLAGSKMLINAADSAFAIGRSVLAPQLRYLKQIKARNSAEKYSDDNVVVCELKKASNFLCFEFREFSPEHMHLRKAVTADLEERRAAIKALSDEGYTQRQIAAQVGVSPGTVNRDLRM